MTSTEASSSEEKAATLRALHVPGDPLVLPNVWDAASARIVEAAGFPVVATSSFATARILGYDDGEAAPVEDVLAAATRIARAVSLPVTVDFERGYGLAPAELVERFAATGAVGLWVVVPRRERKRLPRRGGGFGRGRSTGDVTAQPSSDKTISVPPRPRGAALVRGSTLGTVRPHTPTASRRAGSGGLARVDARDRARGGFAPSSEPCGHGSHARPPIRPDCPMTVQIPGNRR
jgi:hypothetical protein